MIRLPFAIQRYERWRIPALFFAVIAVFCLVIDVTHSDISAFRILLYGVLVLPVALPRNMVYIVIGSLLLTLLGLILLWGLLLLFSWSSGQTHLAHPGIYFFTGFSILCASLFAAATLVYYGLNESVPVKEVKRA